MKREIKFRGVYPHSGQFFYGDLQHELRDNYNILTPFSKTPVKFETLGQYTGLKDKNGVEIYEGDIVKATHRTKGSIYIGSIQMPKSCWVLELKNELVQRRWYRTAEFSQLEVIGNIYEHPELINQTSK